MSSVSVEIHLVIELIVKEIFFIVISAFCANVLRGRSLLQNVVDIAKREAIRDEEAAVQGRAAQAVGAGSFGGTRQALVESEAERNLAERLGDIQARGLSTAFQNAQQAAEAQRQRELAGGRQFAALGDIAGQRARADIGGLAGIGETQQQRSKKKKNSIKHSRLEFQT